MKRGDKVICTCNLHVKEDLKPGEIYCILYYESETTYLSPELHIIGIDKTAIKLFFDTGFEPINKLEIYK